jgi:hypothetical protein
MAKVYGTNLPDILDGLFDGVTDDADTIFGFGGNDWIFGQGGDDILQGGDGADILNGGDGVDTANYGDSPMGVIVNLATGNGSGGTAEGDTLINIENITGSWFQRFSRRQLQSECAVRGVGQRLPQWRRGLRYGELYRFPGRHHGLAPVGHRVGRRRRRR